VGNGELGIGVGAGAGAGFGVGVGVGVGVIVNRLAGRRVEGMNERIETM
jgi:hypothetical protein